MSNSRLECMIWPSNGTQGNFLYKQNKNGRDEKLIPFLSQRACFGEG